MQDSDSSGDTRLKPHPLRAAVLGEVHARPFHPVVAPRVSCICIRYDAEQSLKAREALADFCRQNGVESTPRWNQALPRRLQHDCAALGKHAEFTTYTWSFRRPVMAFRSSSGSMASTMATLPQPGLILRLSISALSRRAVRST